IINRDQSSSMVALLKAEVARLKQQLALATGGATNPLLERSLQPGESLDKSNARTQFLETELDRLSKALDSESKVRRALEERMRILEAERKAILGSVMSDGESERDGEGDEDENDF